VLLSAGNASGQSVSVVDVSLTLLNWTKHLNNDVDKYFTKDKGAELTRNLDALRQDLTLYMKARKGIADSIFRHNISPGKKDPQNQELLKSRMGEVMRQMRNVTDLTNNELRAEGDRLNDQIYEVLNAEGATYLSYLEAFLNGLDVSKKNIALDGSVAYDRLQQSISQLTVTLDKISHKMK
jgi:FlaG/FlaF family flagellin (archaellin)